MGAFTHSKITGYECDAAGDCLPQRTDDIVPLLNLPLVVLTDGPTQSATVRATTPVPHATSRTEPPGLMPAKSTSRRAQLSNNAGTNVDS